MATKDFNSKAPPPALATPADYRWLLEQLVARGTGWGKTQSVGGYLTDDINFVTQTPDSQVKETKNKIEVQKVAVTIDPQIYPLEETRDLIIEDVMKKYGGKMIKKRDPNEPEFEGPGVWLIKRNAFLGDYTPSAANSNTYVPNPEAYRVTLPVDRPVNIPVQWSGGFVIEAGGVLAIRQKDVPALAEALQSIRDGKASVEEALYETDAKTGEKLAKFDIYGMAPGFREGNYKTVDLNDDVKAIQAAFAARHKARPPGAKWHEM